MRYLKVFEEFDVFTEEEIKNLPKKGDIMYWVETGMRYGREIKNEPVKVRFDRMEDIEKGKFANFFLEQDANGKKKGDRCSSSIETLFKSEDEAYMHSRK